MRHMIWLLGAVLALGGCSTRTTGGLPVPGSPDGGVVIVDDDGARSKDGGGGGVMGRSAGVPVGAFLLYHDKAWDTEVDWRREAARRPESVPDMVLRIMSSLVRD